VPKYHFDVHTTADIRDVEGMEFRDLNAAIASAALSARYLAIEEIKTESCFSPNHSIEILDDVGKSLHTTRYGDCINVRP
jgi:hypothetical protein